MLVEIERYVNWVRRRSPGTRARLIVIADKAGWSLILSIPHSA